MDLKEKIYSLAINSEMKSKLLTYVSDSKKAQIIEKAIDSYLINKTKHEESLLEMKGLELRLTKEIREEVEKLDRANEEN